jgi:beta-lactamase regulating signal transducer with metallopeptidase domain
MVTSELESPVLFGAVKPLILLPAWLVDSDEGKLRHLFGHELVHHRHRDALMLAIGQLCLVLFFFNPVAHWVYRQWLWNAELACDRSVVDSNGEAREYARELFSVLEGMQMREVSLSGLYATRFQIGTRVNALLENPMSVSPSLDTSDRVFVLVFGVVLFSLGIGITADWGDDQMYIGSVDVTHRWQEPFEPISSDSRDP